MSRLVELGDGSRLRFIGGADLPLLQLPCGCHEKLSFEQYTGRLSVNHAANRIGPGHDYHETHDFSKAIYG